MSALDPYVTALYRPTVGYQADPAYSDFTAAARADPSLLDEARAEVARLSDTTGRRNLHEPNNGCHESRIRHDMLVQMLAAYDKETAHAE